MSGISQFIKALRGGGGFFQDFIYCFLGAGDGIIGLKVASEGCNRTLYSSQEGQCKEVQ